MSEDRDTVPRQFGEAVDMTAAEREQWLGAEESRSVGQKDGGSESTGHASGRRIVELLQTRQDDLTDGELAHMPAGGTR